MKLVLLSGGSGTRLWPLSNETRSKQFLKVLADEHNNKESMVQRVWRQLQKTSLADQSVVATSKVQKEMITSQLGSEVTVVTEPERRDTFPAIALAAVYLYSVKGCSLDETISVLPVDPYVEDHFFERVKTMEAALGSSSAELALIGVEPTFPTAKYGYIVPKANPGEAYRGVDYFKEKPDEATAQKLIEKGALWNCGVFAFRLGYIIDLLIGKKLPIQYDELMKNYHLLPKTSFDYEVVEKAKDIVVLPYNGYWKDLGTWNTLTEEMAPKITGRGMMDDSSENSHIINELDIPVTVLGIKNAVIAASPDGILVTDKASSPKIKEMVGQFKSRPMYEERRWGWYKVLEHIKYKEGNEILTKRIGVDEGKNLSYQMHYKRSEVWTIVKGEGIFVLDHKVSHVRAGDVIHIPLAARHALKATTDMEIIEVQTGSSLVEEDIYRIALSWEEIERLFTSPVLHN